MCYTKINLLETINLIMSGRLTINTIVLEKYYPTFNLYLSLVIIKTKFKSETNIRQKSNSKGK